MRAAAMARKTNPDSLRPLWASLLLLALPVIIFWSPMFFSILDGWTALIQMTVRRGAPGH